ncbi:hypothetical protein HDV05_001457 [Chytridiales sp. JEL 0842]|nr:hypothetical protein HDV05_001457 [Chytridiales sp. JEL 0842]
MLDVATVLGVSQILNSIAGALGSSIAGTVWNQMVPPLLEKYVPGEKDIPAIMGSTDVALALPQDQYQGVVQAFSEVQRLLTIVSLVLGCLGVFAALMMKPITLKETQYHDPRVAIYSMQHNISQKEK